MPGDSINDTVPTANSTNPAATLAGKSNVPQFYSNPSANSSEAIKDPSGTFVMTDGWYVAIACGVGLLTADTRVGPIVAGILTIALIYQLTLLLQGK